MFGECHAHVIMDGINYKAAVALRSASYRRGTVFSLSLPAAQFFPRFFRTSDAAIGTGATEVTR